MPGGGLFEVFGPGQGTDDTELTLTLANGLVMQRPPKLEIENIAAAYSQWSATKAVDIGSYVCVPCISLLL